MVGRIEELSMVPPWRKYPDIPRFSIGWRMGDGEDYYALFSRWFRGLSDQQAETYSRENPEFEEWEGFYAMLRHGERPSQRVLQIAARKIEERVRRLHEKNS